MAQLAAHRQSLVSVGEGQTERIRDASCGTRWPEDCDAASDGLLAGLQSIGRAAALLDRDGEIVGANALARPYVDMLVGAGLGRSFGRSRSVHQRVRSILDAAQRRDLQDHAAKGQGGAVAFALPEGAMLIVRAAAVGAGEPGLFLRASVLVLFSKLGFDLMPDPHLLRSTFGLTATEAEVALALVGGASASAIARTRAVSLETIRSHLKTIFAKTGTRRQAHLVALILQLRDVAPPG